MQIIRKRKRYSKWPKVETNPDAELVAEYYNVSVDKAKDYVRILDKEDLEYIRNKASRGGLE